MPKGGKNPLDPVKAGNKMIEGNNVKRVTQSRSRSLEATVANDRVTNDSNNKTNPESSCNAKELTSKKKGGASKRLHFEEEYNEVQAATNNNAMIAIPTKKAKTAKISKSLKCKLAKSNPKVVDTNMRTDDENDEDSPFDGIIVGVNGKDSEFGSSESEYEEDEVNESYPNEGGAIGSTTTMGLNSDQNQNLKLYFQQMFDEKMADTKKELALVKQQLAEERQ